MERNHQLVTFYRNGDPHFRGLVTSLNQSQFTSLESMLVWLTEKIETTAGCRFLFRLADGVRIKDIDEVEPGQSYVVSSVKRLISSCAYGQDANRFWYNRRPRDSDGFTPDELAASFELRQPRFEDEQEPEPRPGPSKKRDKRQSTPLMKAKRSRSRRRSDSSGSPRPELQTAHSTHQNGGLRKKKQAVRQPRVITIVSNTNRLSWRRVLINPASTQPFEEMLHDFTNMVVLEKPPCNAIYSAEQPFARITSFSQLFHAEQNTFIVCGREMIPFELLANAESDADSQIHQTRRTRRKSQKIKINDGRHSVSDEDAPDDVRVRIRDAEHVFYPPSNANLMGSQLSKNNKRMQLNWIYGINVKKPKSVLVAPNGELVYYIGNVIVLHDCGQEKQRFYTEHVGMVNALAVHPHGEWAASSALVKQEVESDNSRINSETDADSVSESTTNVRRKHSVCLHVWSMSELSNRKIFQLPFVKGAKIKEIEFLTEPVRSQDLMLLADDDSPYNIYVINWRTGELLAYSRASHSHLLHMRFHTFSSPFAASDAENANDDRISVAAITCGKHHISLWRLLTNTNDNNDLTTRRRQKTERYGLVHVRTVSLVAISNSTKSAQEAESNLETSITQAYQGKPRITAIECDFQGVIVGDSYGTITVWQLPGNRVDAEDETVKLKLKLELPTGVAAIPLDDKVRVSLPKDSTAAERDGRFRSVGNPTLAESLSNRHSKRQPEARLKAVMNGRHRIFQLRNAHDRPIVSLCFFNDGTLVSASADNEIRAWDSLSEYQLVKSRFISTAYGSVVTMKTKKSDLVDGKIYAMMRSGHLLEGSLLSKFVSIVHWHGGPVQCLAAHPREHTFVSSSADDRVVCKWSAVSHRILWKTAIDSAVSCGSFHPDGTLVAFGTVDGTVCFLNSENGQLVATYQVAQTGGSESDSRSRSRSTEADTDSDQPYANASGKIAETGNCVHLSFSPNGVFMAVALNDGQLHVISGKQKFHSRSNKLKKISACIIRLNSPVRNLDWCDDSSRVQIVAENFQLSFWSVPENRNLTAQACRNVRWTTNSCVLGYHVASAWQQIHEAEARSRMEVTACARSICRDQLCVGFSDGTIELARYMARSKSSKAVFKDKFERSSNRDVRKAAEDANLLLFKTTNAAAVHRVESRPVQTLQFLFDDSFLLSLHSQSNAILQWKVYASSNE